MGKARKFNQRQIRDIRQQYQVGRTMRDLAREYRVAFRTIFDICHGYRYRERG